MVDINFISGIICGSSRERDQVLTREDFFCASLIFENWSVRKEERAGRKDLKV
jgi:hypothetical protein